jgi:hypothetical protein
MTSCRASAILHRLRRVLPQASAALDVRQQERHVPLGNDGTEASARVMEGIGLCREVGHPTIFQFPEAKIQFTAHPGIRRRVGDLLRCQRRAAQFVVFVPLGIRVPRKSRRDSVRRSA